MRVVVFVKATEESEQGVPPSQELLADMMAFNEELVKAGVMLAGDGLHPSVKGKRIVFSGKDRKVVDGPFAEAKELVAGFWIWQVKSIDEAVAWAKRCPNPMPSGGVLEIRPILGLEDFGIEIPAEIREKEERLRAQSEELARKAQA